ncbi:MAG: hypothetical protein B6240_13940 [Desulfobacteraceae bacterium 4572_87]|nr:MAG: hypothetical protein B6240_13940 [Desulfobacteraceae bacterium 4572_87]
MSACLKKRFSRFPSMLSLEPRKRSQFINIAIRHLLKQKQAERLAAEYRDAVEEIRTINCDLEGTISDGLD